MLRPGRGNVHLPTTYGGGGGGVGYGGGDSGPGYGGYSSSTAGNGSTYGNGREKSRSPRNRQGSFALDGVRNTLRNPGLYGYLLAFFFFICMLSYRSGQNQLLNLLDSKKFKDALVEIKAAKRQKENLQNQLNNARETQKVMAKKQVEADGNNRKLQREMDELKTKHEGPERATEQLKVKTREEAWKNQVQLLQQATSRESRRAATEKYVVVVLFCRLFLCFSSWIRDDHVTKAHSNTCCVHLSNDDPTTTTTTKK
jgi:hypothetical protein